MNCKFELFDYIGNKRINIEFKEDHYLIHMAIAYYKLNSFELRFTVITKYDRQCYEYLMEEKLAKLIAIVEESKNKSIYLLELTPKALLDVL
jgi:hypothetical protein